MSGRNIYGLTVFKGFGSYFLAAIIISITALLCMPLSNTPNYHIVSYILLFAVSIMATIMGIGPVLFASTLSALVWNFFFIPPHFTFHIDKAEDILIFGLFFIIAFVNGVLTTRVRMQEKLAIEREEHSNALFQLTKQLSKAFGIEKVLSVANEEIEKNFEIDCFFILQDGNNRLGTSILLIDQPEEMHLAEWVFKNQTKAGTYTDVSPGSKYTFCPLAGTKISPGVLAIKSEFNLSVNEESFWDIFLTQISNALEREFLGELAQKVRFLHESDRLYKTLFNSISHEFRIPVATIMGASDSLLNSHVPENTQAALCNEIFTASLRLNRLIENLLNISRLESGHISVHRNWHDINDLVNKVAEDLREELKPFTVIIIIPDEMPLVKIDFGLIEQVLYNLLFNAAQNSPTASEIRLETSYLNGELIISVMDNGSGFPEEALPNVFKKFYRVNKNKSGGLGLGLSIVKGFVEAHNGRITVENRPEGGVNFTINIPSEKPGIINLQTDI